jgi:hypothetical protein
MNRLQVFDLDDMYSKHKKELVLQIYKRMAGILNLEGVKFDKKDLTNVIVNYYPSSRNILMFLQKNSVNGELKFSSLERPDSTFESLVDAMKRRKFKEVKEIVNEILVPDSFYTYVYKNLDIFKPESQPEVIISLADYQDYSQRAKNKHIPLLAFVVKIISDPGVKFES